MNRQVIWSVVYILLIMTSPGPVVAAMPDSTAVTGVVGYPQSYMLSCESRSAVDWAAFWGVKIGETEFLAGLPNSDNPEVGFVGSPHDRWGDIPPYSYGVHAEPVAKLLRAYGVPAEAWRGADWDDLRAEIAAGRPVIIWVIGQMWDGVSQSYTAADGQVTTVARFEHTMILTGYTPEVVQVIDANTGWFVSYPLSSFLRSWSVLGNMAVVSSSDPTAPEMVLGFRLHLPLVQGASQPLQPEQSQAAPGESGIPETYIVQPGDYLVALGREFGLDWLHLAVLNNIWYPYVIYPGQMLRLR